MPIIWPPGGANNLATRGTILTVGWCWLLTSPDESSWNYHSLTKCFLEKLAHLKVKQFWFEIILGKLGFRIILVMQKLPRRREYNWKVLLVPSLLQHVSFTFWLKQISTKKGETLLVFKFWRSSWMVYLQGIESEWVGWMIHFKVEFANPSNSSITIDLKGCSVLSPQSVTTISLHAWE